MAAQLRPFTDWWLYVDERGWLRFSCRMRTPEQHKERAARWCAFLADLTGLTWRADLRRDPNRDTFSYQYRATTTPALHLCATVDTPCAVRETLALARRAHPDWTLFWIKNVHGGPAGRIDYSVVAACTTIVDAQRPR